MALALGRGPWAVEKRPKRVKLEASKLRWHNTFSSRGRAKLYRRQINSGVCHTPIEKPVPCKLDL